MATRRIKDSTHLERLKAPLDITIIRVASVEGSKIKCQYRITITITEQKAMVVVSEIYRESHNCSLQSKNILKGRAWHRVRPTWNSSRHQWLTTQQEDSTMCILLRKDLFKTRKTCEKWDSRRASREMRTLLDSLSLSQNRLDKSNLAHLGTTLAYLAMVASHLTWVEAPHSSRTPAVRNRTPPNHPSKTVKVWPR